MKKQHSWCPKEVQETIIQESIKENGDFCYQRYLQLLKEAQEKYCVQLDNKD